MKLSIITTIYKAEKDLPRLLDSMMVQKSPELEFFLIDNGSPDKCGEICKEYANKDSRFKVFTLEENIGYIRARNLGIKEVEAEFIGFCDSDDYLEPEAYDKAIQIIKEYSPDLYLTSYRTVFENTEVINHVPYETGLYEGKDVYDKILPQAFGSVNGKAQLHGFAWKQIFKRDLIIGNNLSFMPELQPYEDQIFNIDVINNSKRIYIDDNVLYNYIVNEQSITAKLLLNFSLEEAWRRIALLYNEKKKRATENSHIEGYTNQTLSAIYSIMLSLAKQKSKSIIRISRDFKNTVDDEIIRHVINNESNSSKRLSFLCKCLKNKKYFLILLFIRIAVKMKGKK